MKWLITVLIATAALQLPSTSTRRVAITIDDLPRGGDGGSQQLADVLAMTEKLMRPFRTEKIPVIGFVNARSEAELGEAGLRQVLDRWLDAGATLGNHSHSHLNINNVPLGTYTDDIAKGEPAIRAALNPRGQTLRYYRHPFLFTGPTDEIKRGLQSYLDVHGYRIAPVTIDNADYMYAALYMKPEFRDRVRKEYVRYMESVVSFFETRSVEVVGHEFPQILLIHASEMNADLMPELLAMLKKRGYTFVTLDHALADPAYTLPEHYVGRNGFSWIHRWSQTKGMPNKGEPDPPEWVQENYAKR
jgi:peptidoglycan/xylan/chitin deacetylase (PgdA/CDA1 family)